MRILTLMPTLLAAPQAPTQKEKEEYYTPALLIADGALGNMQELTWSKEYRARGSTDATAFAIHQANYSGPTAEIWRIHSNLLNVRNSVANACTTRERGRFDDKIGYEVNPGDASTLQMIYQDGLPRLSPLDRTKVRLGCHGGKMNLGTIEVNEEEVCLLLAIARHLDVAISKFEKVLYINECKRCNSDPELLRSVDQIIRELEYRPPEAILRNTFLDVRNACMRVASVSRDDRKRKRYPHDLSEGTPEWFIWEEGTLNLDTDHRVPSAHFVSVAA